MRRTSSFTILAAAALLAGCHHAGPSGTAPLGSLALNSEVTGRLTAPDKDGRGGSALQVWTFHGTAGDMVRVDVMSSQFDTYVAIEDEAGRELAHDDDSGGGTNARVRFAVPATGVYRIFVRSFREGGYGAYRLRIQRLGTVAAGGNGSTIQRGQLLTGRLSPTDPRMSDNSIYHVYTYLGRAGEAVTIDVMSPDFDAFAILQDPQGNEVARDDDSGEGTDARITTTLRQTGVYRIIVNTYAAGASGSYTVWVH